MSRKCSKCLLVNYKDASRCVRCDAVLDGRAKAGLITKIAVRGTVCGLLSLAILLAFYLSLIGSAKSLTVEEKAIVRGSIRLLKDKGFESEVFYLEHLTAFRADDHWLNASVAKENAYAATNFPFEIMTLYGDFFTYPKDDVERAAILLHEARHLKGEDEHEAYTYVWLNRERLGWTRERYYNSPVWEGIRSQTRDVAPEMFTCVERDFGDCTEN